MNREDVIRWMQEVGAKENNPTPQTYEGFVDIFKQFAALAAEWGAKQEREACAMVCEEVGNRDVDTHAWDAADAIRARFIAVPRPAHGWRGRRVALMSRQPMRVA